MDFETETTRARVAQLKRDRWPYVIGHMGATVVLVAVAWTAANRTGLMWFAAMHHLATWVLAISLYVPLRFDSTPKMPMFTYIGVGLVNAMLSSALLFDIEAAKDLTFTLMIGTILFAGAAGSFVTLGMHSSLQRVAITSLLLPYILTALCLGHTAVALGTMFFYCNVVIAGVWKLSTGQEELIALRIKEAARAEIAEMDAETDHLTRLRNRRGIERLEGMELTAGVAALYFDVNRFKEINDTYGHTVGDEVLMIVAKRLRGAVSAKDVVARLGGDEFLVLIFGDQAKAADAVIARLCDRLQQPVVVSGGHILDVSAAVGQSYSEGPTLKLKHLLRDSDQSMYQSKHQPSRAV